MNSGVSITSMAAGVEKPDCPAQSPDLNLLQHLWDELEQRLQFWFSHPTMNTLLNLEEDVYRIVAVAGSGDYVIPFLHMNIIVYSWLAQNCIYVEKYERCFWSLI
ncbi:hypothetical protein XENOCAPTIV_008906 [Xenoophorus captivus]|uniref:Uncharacterized protein n=1 Tax=Xenoophorus captivus TaxID=1517983 RepID=A0ABV0RKA6_9TELE